jgi:hypothetical protein
MPGSAKRTDYRPNDSSRTRVAPFFEALASWPRRLLDLAAPGSGPHPWTDQDLTPTKYYWGNQARGRKEYSLNPPKALLEELLRNPKLPKRGMPKTSKETMEARQRLLDGDADTLSEGTTRPGKWQHQS